MGCEAVAALQNHTPFKLELPGIDRGRLNLAVVHAAHLMWFREFGYRYLFTAGGHYTRSLLSGANRLDDGAFLTMQIPRGTMPPSLRFRIGVCTYPSRIKCLFACIPDPDPIYEGKFVLLPGLNAEDVQQFSLVLAQADSWTNVDFRTMDGGPARRLSAPEYRDSLARLWQGWEHHQIDLTELMKAIHFQADCDSARRIDSAPIAARFGIRREALNEYLAHLVSSGFLERVPQNKQPYLVRLTNNGRVAVEQKQAR